MNNKTDYNIDINNNNNNNKYGNNEVCNNTIILRTVNMFKKVLSIR